MGHNNIQFNFFGHVRSHNTKVYHVKHMSFYTNITKSPARKDYVGRQALIRNETNNCVKAITLSDANCVEDKCDEPGYKDQQLQLWRTTSTPNIRQQERHSQSVVAWPSILIYCWGNNITIVEDLNRAETTKC